MFALCKLSQGNEKSTAASQEEKALQYFAQLDTNTIKRLARLYKYDFEMFGYQYENYL